MPKPWERGYFGAADSRSPAERVVIGHACNLRAEIIAMETLLGSDDNGLTAKQLKRLDKAVTVAKVALKIMKKAMRARVAAQANGSAT